MTIYKTPMSETARGLRRATRAAALAAAFVVSLLQPARAGEITPPPVPPNLEIEEGNIAFLVGHAAGTQNYVCLPSATAPSGFAFTLFTPQATLFNDDGGQIITHFFSPNPDEDGTPIRATWEHSRDTSTVWAALVPDGSSRDRDFVEEGAVDWLKLAVVGDEEGPTEGDKLTKTTFIQRLNTSGGLAPSTGCSSAADVGNRAFVPYSADYFFYRKAGTDRDR
jgi:hypothetical protein